MTSPPFLQRLANALLEAHGTDLHRVAVVLPSQRAGSHLRRWLGRSAGRTIWSPQVLTMPSFLEQLADARVADALHLQFDLYDLYREVVGSSVDDLSTFLQWGPTLLRDMSEVDAHLIDLENLYRDLRAYQDIEDWSLDRADLSPGQQRLIRYWDMAGRMHKANTIRQQERGTGHAGFVARRAAERVVEGKAVMPWDHIWLAGLNALDPSQRTICKALVRSGIARVAWDADHYYLDDPAQEAGTSLRQLINELGPGTMPLVDDLRTTERSILSVQVPDSASVAWEAAARIAQLPEAAALDTVVVLADNALLPSLLQALPGSIKDLNITMGIPLSVLPVHGMLNAFHAVQQRNADAGGIPLELLSALLLHPFLRVEGHTEKTLKALRENGHARVSLVDFHRSVAEWPVPFPDHIAAAVAPVLDIVKDMPGRHQALLAWARLCTEGHVLETEQLYHLAQAQHDLDLLLARYGHAPDAQTYLRLHARLVMARPIGLFGEPLAGIQVTGVLETRAIDHQQVILLGANEGILPPAAEQNSFIPFEVRRVHGLPLNDHGDAVSAYHFFRGMQRAGSVTLIHSADAQNGSGEPSRFIAQIREELVPASNTGLHEEVLTVPVPVRQMVEIAVRKSPAVLEGLHALLRKGLSPSAVATYFRCPLDMYFTYVLRIREQDELSNSLASNTLGMAVHEAMEDLYRPFIGTDLAADDLRERRTMFRDLLLRSAANARPGLDLEYGQARLQLDMASAAATAFIDHDIQRSSKAKIHLEDLEHDLSALLDVEIQGEVIPVRFIGRMDRKEIVNGELCIIDMKTGNVQRNDLKIKELSAEELHAKPYALQLLIYAWMQLRSAPDLDHVRAGIIPLQRTSSGDLLELVIGDRSGVQRDRMSAIDTLLAEVVQGIMDPTAPFMHEPKSRYCRTCIGVQ